MSKEDKPDAWMPLYIGDYLGDTGRLTTEQHGAYLLIIMDYWRNGPPPDNDAALSEVTKLGRRNWAKHRQALSRFFVIVEGQWRHKRIDEELERWSEKKLKAVERAKKAGEARWKGREIDAPSNATSTPQALLDECPSSSSSKVEPLKGSTLTASKLDCAPLDGAPSLRSKPELVAGIDVAAEHQAQREADKIEVKAMLAALKRGGR